MAVISNDLIVMRYPTKKGIPVFIQLIGLLVNNISFIVNRLELFFIIKFFK